jgi:hypothetical protein
MARGHPPQIDNARLHDMSSPCAFGYCLTFNIYPPPAGAELCLDPIFGYTLMQKFGRLARGHTLIERTCACRTNTCATQRTHSQHKCPATHTQTRASAGWATVSHFLVAAAELARVKDGLNHLEDVEGAVLYHLNEGGVVRMEKAKCQGYVVVRALREKTRVSVSACSPRARALASSACGLIPWRRAAVHLGQRQALRLLARLERHAAQPRRAAGEAVPRRAPHHAGCSLSRLRLPAG